MTKAKKVIDMIEAYEAKIVSYADSSDTVNGKRFRSIRTPYLYNSKTPDYWVVFRNNLYKNSIGDVMFTQKAGSLDSAKKIEKAILNDVLPDRLKGRVDIGFIYIVEPSNTQDSGLYKELGTVGSVDIVKELKSLYTKYGVYED